MISELIPWLGVATILSLGIFVQAAAGFAAGMLIVPTLLWLGYGIPEAAMALLVATVPQNVFGVYKLRDAIVPRRIVWPGFARIVFFPLGAILLIVMEERLPVVQLRQLVGAVVLAATIATIVYRPQPREKLAPIWAWIAFPVSGLLQGLVGMGGPAMVFWVNAHDWSTRQIRGFLFAMYLVSLPPAFAFMFLLFGDRLIQPALVAMASMPALLMATSLGLRFGNWLGRQRLRRITIGLLILVGIVGIAAPLIQPR